VSKDQRGQHVTHEAEATLRQALVAAQAKLRQAEGPAEAKLQQALVDAQAKLQQAEGPAAAKLQQALVDAQAKLRQAEVPAAAKLQQALVDAEAKLRQAEGPAEAKLQQALVEADAKLQQALGPAEAKLQQALVDALAKLQQAEDPADAKLQQALVDALAKLRQAEGPARAKLEQALVEAQAKLRQAEGPAEAKIQQALVEADAKLQRAELAADAKLRQAVGIADAKLRQAQQELAQQRDVFERFFALSLDMMCISSSDGYFTRVSPSFDALGYSNVELLSRPSLDFIHPDDRAATLAASELLVRGAATINFENRYRCKDGSYRWLSWVSGPDSSGTLYSMARDVTESKRTQEALARAKDAADAMNQELESFSYSVAHDLRSPLRSIDGFSQALLEDYAQLLDADGKQYLSFIRESAQHMAQLIDDLLGLSRVTRAEWHCERIDLSVLARAANTRLQRSQPERRVEVVVQDGLVADGDPRLIAVVLDNLFGNAWKFTAKREHARIEFGASSKDGKPVYFVRDNGAGFDMAFANKLFRVFQRLHTASEFEGTGVGLATVQRVVNRHGGRVWAQAQVDRGATFYFTLHETEGTT
jgi:PAS domain S-box-containing protein